MLWSQFMLCSLTIRATTTSHQYSSYTKKKSCKNKLSTFFPHVGSNMLSQLWLRSGHFLMLLNLGLGLQRADIINMFPLWFWYRTTWGMNCLQTQPLVASIIYYICVKGVFIHSFKFSSNYSAITLWKTMCQPLLAVQDRSLFCFLNRLALINFTGSLS